MVATVIGVVRLFWGVANCFIMLIILIRWNKYKIHTKPNTRTMLRLLRFVLFIELGISLASWRPGLKPYWILKQSKNCSKHFVWNGDLLRRWRELYSYKWLWFSVGAFVSSSVASSRRHLLRIGFSCVIIVKVNRVKLKVCFGFLFVVLIGDMRVCDKELSWWTKWYTVCWLRLRPGDCASKIMMEFNSNVFISKAWGWIHHRATIEVHHI